MKTMKLWRIAFVMLTAFSLASCGSNVTLMAPRRIGKIGSLVCG